MTSDEKLVMNLSRSYLGLAIASGAAQIAVIVTLICGTWPGDCKRIRKFALYTSATVILTLALLSSVASGVCFIAARDVEDDDLHLYKNLDTSFGWSFMLHWIGAGLMLIDGIVLLCLMTYAHEDVGEWQKNFYDL